MTAYSREFLKIIAKNLNRELGLPPVSVKEISDMCGEDYPVPILKTNSEGCVWLDRYYAAFMLNDGILRYVYISKFHMREEADACRLMNAELPGDVKAQFAAAREFMNRTNSNVWLETRDYSTVAKLNINK